MKKTTFDQVKDILKKDNKYNVIISGCGIQELIYVGHKNYSFCFYNNDGLYDVPAGAIILEDDSIHNMNKEFRDFCLNIIKKEKELKK